MAAEELSSSLRDVLNSTVNGKLHKYNITFGGENSEGMGYTSTLLYLTLKHKETEYEVHVVVKQLLSQNGAPVEYLVGPFANEIYFYDHIWPTLQKFYQTATTKTIDIVPVCYTTSSADFTQKLVLDDLKASNFKLHDPKMPFNEIHMERIFECYAAYHGISMAFRHIYPEEYAKLVAPLLDIWTEDVVQYVSDSRTKNLEAIAGFFDGKAEKDVVTKLRTFTDDFCTINTDLSDYRGKNDVILHYDCWSNNIMFKYDGIGNIKDIRLLDFQLTRSGSPIFDLAHCFYSNGSKRLWDDADYYLDVYHNKISSTLRDLGCDPKVMYSRVIFKQEWRRLRVWGFILGTGIWRIKLAPETSTSSVKDKLNDAANKEVLRCQEEYKQIIRDLTFHACETNMI